MSVCHFSHDDVARTDGTKQMLEKEDGAFFCKDCNFGHGSYRLSMVLSMLLDDYLDELPVTVFNEWAEELLGELAPFQKSGTPSS